MKKRKMGRVAAPPVMGNAGVQVNEHVRPYVPTIIGGMGQEDMRTTLPDDEEEGFKITPLMMVGAGVAAFLGYKLLKG